MQGAFPLRPMQRVRPAGPVGAELESCQGDGAQADRVNPAAVGGGALLQIF